MNLLLLSNSTNHGEGYMDWCREIILDFLPTQAKVAFVPYAGFYLGYDSYTEKVKTKLSDSGITIKGVHEGHPQSIIAESEVIMIGGGNTFYLLKQLHELNLLRPIQQKIKEGGCYVGWSAGSNVACPAITTTNDMPIVEPPSFNALHLFPHQINPHYTDKAIEGHGGESRDQRLKEFIMANPEEKVYALPESSFIISNKNSAKYMGTSIAHIFNREGKMDLKPESIVQ